MTEAAHDQQQAKAARPETIPWDRDRAGYAELCVTTNFTFLTGASHPEELVLRAAELGLGAIAITDRNTLAGVVRAYSALKTLHEETSQPLPVRSLHQVDPSSREKIGQPQDLHNAGTPHLPKLIVGSRLVLRDCPVDWLALPTDRAAYHRLSRLLTLGKRRAEKAECHLDMQDLEAGCRGMILIALPPADLGRARAPVQRLARRFPGAVFLGVAPRYDGSDQGWFDACAAMAQRCAAPMVAVGDVLMHHGKRRQLADVLTCLREGITIDQIGTKALPNAERRLKGASDMARLYHRYPAALKRSLEIAARCGFDLSELSYEYPDEMSEGEPPQARLARLADEGVKRRYPNGASARVHQLMQKELSLIDELRYAPYFLTVHDIVQEARSRGILCQGRGSAANSILCYLLGITDVSPDMIGMVFERFISRHRGEPPDIDVDFEHERREEVIQWIYEKYGRHRAGLCATVIHFRTRAAIREVGKVMGLSQDITARLSGDIWGMSNAGVDMDRVRAIGLDPTDLRLAQTLKLIGEVIGFPRHLSQHVGGFVITRGRLDEMCPIENAAMEDRTVIEWDKDDIDALNILKIDILSLGMLTCLRKSFELLADHQDMHLTLDTVPQEDRATYEMLQRADAVGVFQVESRAQMNFLPRMKPATFYDLVIEVAIVRPGPIQGGMVKPYICRRQGLEAPEPFGPALAEVTRKTLGVPLFQEQAMQIAIVGASYTAEEADKLRRSLATFRRLGTIGEHRDRFVRGMMNNGYAQDVAEACFAQIEGFADYGFPESHAAAFAMLTYISSWLKCHHPAVFACALLNSQPMGFYAPAQIVRDLRDHRVEVRPVCVNHSEWDNRLERRADGMLALRLGFRQIKGFREEDAGWLKAARGNGYQDPESVWLRAGIAPSVLERLAEADAFIGMGLTRRDALWQVRAIRAPKPLPLFADPLSGENIHEPEVHLPTMHLGEEVVEDYISIRLTLRAHPMELLRPMIPDLTPHDRLPVAPLKRTSVCGLVITRQRPGTASGVVFLTLEDETGVSNVVVWPTVYKRFRRVVMGGRLLRVTGRLEREGIVVHLIAEHIEDLSHKLSELGHPRDDAVGITQPQADDAPRPRHKAAAHHPREQAKRLFPSRDFH
ncbi:error-prone DNA polymerase [Sulfitobacter pseudonitzschiae]|uniref:Error-prone DNA polymerase n=1 Tax=Pseudosulfitobacter pseudonitzschiae TaxID=1402135 RepID=A0A9Q2NR26_9RHOB|nr:error-prone DNA polymerase [Pseudosulfitobacter pseudonitzschiae]MBM2294054.1 error-prone DNA polymerase [Pseudosulfitobacter pseudonitzschiae]MBM2298977.1 error-prone DNA polymerase [Pseudosulfitobacter pseudonitzschiae]MBM2303885.1 error-prone DNA polymerase [Pseudosulfitobacter pseudonitzschiae]MBM2313619.1 error-prone DNA polymerase [Pseudosulfitobacter pseudonitzschiae]MBM2318533.1 error-prone DNA polymerase [Pseudosulfitobacter pseudonitzschiae]